MKPLLTGKEMKKCDEVTINDFCVPSCVLMERAALAVVAAMEERDLCTASIGVFCGTGNNGGDGLAVSRLLYLSGYDVRFFVCGDKSHFSEEAKRQYQICLNYHVPEAAFSRELTGCEVILDSMFGIGLSRNLEGEYRDLIAEINQSLAYKIAVDIPSGVNADTGAILGCACRCDLTVTFGFAKAGQFLMPGASCCGEVLVRDVGIAAGALESEKTQYAMLEPSDVSLLPALSMERHKGNAGKVLVIAGGEHMAGAAFLSAKAAFRMGCGMIRVYTSICNHMVLQSLLPEAVLVDYEKTFSEKQLLEQIQWADVILVGPGMGIDGTAEKIVAFVIKNAAVPVVCDADCLNIFSKHRSLLSGPHTELILTPHIGEMARLTGESILYIKDHMTEAAAEFAREYQVTCVLKDARSIVCVPYETTYINAFGNPGMATAGSGDVLAGVIAGCVAQRVPMSLAAALGVLIHALAGDFAAKKNGMRSLMASDIAEEIGRAAEWREI